MEIEKTLLLNAPPERVWALLLDPTAMGAWVPGMESIEVISDTEHVAVMSEDFLHQRALQAQDLHC
jgi:carbon monoxide dehydrogenase subunit G